MQKHFFLFLILISMFLLAGKVSAQTDTSGTLETVVVTATRAKTNAYKLPFSANLVSSVQMARSGARTTPEALSESNGVFIQKTNHGGGSAFVRGLTGNQTLLMLDGIRFNNATFRFGPNQYLNTVDMYTVDRAEVIKGTGSVQYGSDAMGGVVQLFTKELSFEKTGFHASVLGKTISNDMEYTGRADIAYQSEKLTFSAGYTSRKFGDLYGGDTTGRQFYSGYTEKAYDAKLRWQPSANTIVTLYHQSVGQHDVPLYHRIKLENYAYYSFDPQQRSLSYLKLETHTTSKWLERVSMQVSVQHTREKRSYYRRGNANSFIEEDKVCNTGATIDVLSLPAKNWQINQGVEYYHDKISSYKLQQPVSGAVSQTLRGLYPEGAAAGNFSLYSLHHLQFGKLTVEAGLRYNTLHITIPDTSLQAISSGKVTVKPSSLVTNIGAAYEISKHNLVYASFSTGYRAPNIDDLGSLGLVDFRYEIPSYNLKPEKSYHTEIGYRFRSSKMQSGIAFYYMHLADLITRVQVQGQQINGYNVYTKLNSQQSYIKGVEYTAQWELSSHFRLQGNASYCFGQNLSAGEPLRRIPPFNGRIQCAYQKNKWFAGIEDVFAWAQTRLAQGDKDDNRIPAGGTPGWNLVNLNMGYETNTYSVRTGIQNLLNVDYRTHGSGINGMGRGWWLSIGVKI